MKKAEMPMHERILTDDPTIRPSLDLIQQKLGLTQRQVRLLVSRTIRKERPGDCHPKQPYEGNREAWHEQRVRSSIMNRAFWLQAEWEFL